MKGILGRKVGMTSMFLSNGQTVGVTLIQVDNNVVTSTFDAKKDGYTALQLATVEKRLKSSNKPETGHFKKANTAPKRFVKEIRGMEGFKVGDIVPLTIFVPGEFVDVTGVSKGKGFAGTIKRHNQKIGPKSHGGGGGSQPLRQTGSIGTMRAKRVFKGMTMPGHLGDKQRTVQNLEIIEIDAKHNLLIVKGSIPGANKSFLVVKNAAKGLVAKAPVELVNLFEVRRKNELLEEAKRFGANVNTDMSVEEMENAVQTAKVARETFETLTTHKTNLKTFEDQIAKLREQVQENAEQVKALGEQPDEEKSKQLAEKVTNLEQQLKTTLESLAKEKALVVEWTGKYEVAEKTAKAAQVEVEEIKEETTEPKKDTKEVK